MIYTLTLNTVMDKIAIVRNFTIGETLLADKVELVAAGKGITAARGAKAAGGDVVIIGLVGSEDLSFYARSLGEEGIPSSLIPVPGRTRINTTLLDPDSGNVTHIRERGLTVAPALLERLIGKLENGLKRGDLFILSGSLPPGLPDDSYSRLVRLGKKSGALTILDTSREPLRLGMDEGPYMVKPNHTELEEVYGANLKSEGDIIKVAGELCQKGIELVVVSRGEDGVIVAHKGETWSARVRLDPDKIINTVGCGDALVGGMAAAIASGSPIEEIIKMGVACAGANATTMATGLCRQEDIECLYPKVELKKIGV